MAFIEPMHRNKPNITYLWFIRQVWSLEPLLFSRGFFVKECRGGAGYWLPQHRTGFTAPPRGRRPVGAPTWWRCGCRHHHQGPRHPVIEGLIEGGVHTGVQGGAHGGVQRASKVCRIGRFQAILPEGGHKPTGEFSSPCQPWGQARGDTARQDRSCTSLHRWIWRVTCRSSWALPICSCRPSSPHLGPRERTGHSYRHGAPLCVIILSRRTRT